MVIVYSYHKKYSPLLYSLLQWFSTLTFNNSNFVGSFKCADENEVCLCKGTVKYGLDPNWSKARHVGSRIECTNEVFGDSSYRTRKECNCMPLGM